MKLQGRGHECYGWRENLFHFSFIKVAEYLSSQVQYKGSETYWTSEPHIVIFRISGTCWVLWLRFTCLSRGWFFFMFICGKNLELTFFPLVSRTKGSEEPQATVGHVWYIMLETWFIPASCLFSFFLIRNTRTVSRFESVLLLLFQWTQVSFAYRLRDK
jgi:hypothetical protein